MHHVLMASEPRLERQNYRHYELCDRTKELCRLVICENKLYQELMCHAQYVHNQETLDYPQKEPIEAVIRRLLELHFQDRHGNSIALASAVHQLISPYTLPISPTPPHPCPTPQQSSSYPDSPPTHYTSAAA